MEEAAHNIEINTNVVHLHSWLVLTPTGYMGMSRVREMTAEGRVVRDKTTQTGLVVEWTKPRPFWGRLLSVF